MSKTQENIDLEITVSAGQLSATIRDLQKLTDQLGGVGKRIEEYLGNPDSENYVTLKMFTSGTLTGASFIEVHASTIKRLSKEIRALLKEAEGEND